mmetsp:Transcript_32021/g.46151  ORF Transcript_32021/g.46151 Transcript_32021/m.46151 type:complete len:411 (+) Transcript_32021:115-1347(+)
MVAKLVQFCLQISALSFIAVSDSVLSNGVKNLRVVVSTSEKYIPLLFNWLLYYKKIFPDSSSLYIICLDEVVENQLPNYGLNCSHVHYLPPRSSIHTLTILWQIRSNAILQLLRNDFDILMSDSDAIWISNPLPTIFSLVNAADIISSRAQFPEDIARKAGATLCMGFIYIRANKGTTALWQDFYYFMLKQKSSDDQRDFNVYLLANGLHYSNPPKIFISSIVSTKFVYQREEQITPTQEQENETNFGELMIFIPSNRNDSHIVSTSSSKSNQNVKSSHSLEPFLIRIALLPHSKFRRTCYPTPLLRMNHTNISTTHIRHHHKHSNIINNEVYLPKSIDLQQCIIAHCSAVKRGTDSNKRGINHSILWLLRSDWKKIPTPFGNTSINGHYNSSRSRKERFDDYFNSISVS